MKRAFTLIELLVYMAIMGFIIVVAGRVFSDSTKMRVRSQGMLKSSEEIGKLSTLLSEDISQMGIKERWGQETVDGDYKFIQLKDVYWNINKKDSSSYRLINEGASDHLTFKKAVFENGEFVVHQIEWYVKWEEGSNGKGKLYRKCRPMLNKTAADDCTGDSVLIASNITNFKLIPYKPVQNDSILFEGQFYLYPRPTDGNVIQLDPVSQTGTRTEIFGFGKNPEGNFNRYEFYLAKYKDSPSNWTTDCEPFELEENNIYVIEFKMPFSGKIESDPTKKEQYYNSTQFQPGKDHLSMGFRDKGTGNTIDNNKLPDVLFYPQQPQPDDNVETVTRHLEFPVKTNKPGACAAITFAFYSPTAYNGRYEFSDFKVFRKAKQSFKQPSPDENYGIGDDDTDKKRNEKKSVKAFELLLEMDHKGEKSGTFSQIDKVSKEKKGMIIATPNNGITVDIDVEETE